MTPSGAAATDMRKAMLGRVNLPGLAVIAVAIALWQLYASTIGARFDSIASSTAIFAAIQGAFVDGVLLEQLAHTASIALAGWIIASVLGFTIGLLIGVSNAAWTYSLASSRCPALHPVDFVRAGRGAVVWLFRHHRADHRRLRQPVADVVRDLEQRPFRAGRNSSTSRVCSTCRGWQRCSRSPCRRRCPASW